MSSGRRLRIVADEPVGTGFGPTKAWADHPGEVAEECRRAFSRGRSLTVGLEEELILLEPTTLQPTGEIEGAPVHGTLEFRVADAQTRSGEAGAIAALCQALVAALAARYDSGEELPVHDTHRIAENRWRGVRDGLDGLLVDLDTGVSLPSRVRIDSLLADLEPVAESLGAGQELLAARTLLEENGAQRQRRIAAESGVDSVIRRLADETEPWPERHLFLVGERTGG